MYARIHRRTVDCILYIISIHNTLLSTQYPVSGLLRMRCDDESKPIKQYCQRPAESTREMSQTIYKRGVWQTSELEHACKRYCNMSLGHFIMVICKYFIDGCLCRTWVSEYNVIIYGVYGGIPLQAKMQTLCTHNKCTIITIYLFIVS